MTVLLFLVAPISGRLTVRVPVRLILARRARAGRRRARADGGPARRLAAARTCCPASSSAASASASSTRRSPRRPSRVVPPNRSGMASGINSTFRQVGIATGDRRPRRDLPARGLGADAGRRSRAAASRAPSLRAHARPAREHLRLRAAPAGSRRRCRRRCATRSSRSFDSAFASALNEILLIAAVVALVGAIGGLVLVRTPRLRREPGQRGAGRSRADAGAAAAGRTARAVRRRSGRDRCRPAAPDGVHVSVTICAAAVASSASTTTSPSRIRAVEQADARGGRRAASARRA